MEYRQLGRSGLRVPALALATTAFGGQGNFAKTGSLGLVAARRLIAWARGAGVTLIDTADTYTRGLAEEIVGTALKETPRALDDLQSAGKVRYVGASNYSGRHLMKWLAVSKRDRAAHFASQQSYYSLQAREAEHDLVPIAPDQGAGILVSGPLAGGLLSGTDRRDCRPDAESRQLTDRQRAAGARHVGRPGSPGLAAGPAGRQCGPHRRAHRTAVRGQSASADLTVTESERVRLDAVGAPPLRDRHWHQAMTASGRLGPSVLSLIGRHLRR